MPLLLTLPGATVVRERSGLLSMTPQALHGPAPPRLPAFAPPHSALLRPFKPLISLFPVNATPAATTGAWPETRVPRNSGPQNDQRGACSAHLIPFLTFTCNFLRANLPATSSCFPTFPGPTLCSTNFLFLGNAYVLRKLCTYLFILCLPC